VAEARPACKAEYGDLVRLQVQVGELEGVPGDPVALLVVEVLVDAAELERDAQVAQLGLVPLEHLLEGLVLGALVALDDVADAFLGDVVPGDEQHDHEVHQPLGLRCRHGVPPLN
jgi:hypothetical protein